MKAAVRGISLRGAGFIPVKGQHMLVSVLFWWSFQCVLMQMPDIHFVRLAR